MYPLPRHDYCGMLSFSLCPMCISKCVYLYNWKSFSFYVSLKSQLLKLKQVGCTYRKTKLNVPKKILKLFPSTSQNSCPTSFPLRRLILTSFFYNHAQRIYPQRVSIFVTVAAYHVCSSDIKNEELREFLDIVPYG